MGGPLSAARTSLNAVVPGLPLGDILLGNIGAFKKGFVFEVIDSKNPGEALFTKSLVINPRVYTLSEPFAVTLTPTEDNTVVAEENGQIIREIVLEGTTGLMERNEEAFGRGGQIGTNGSGPEHFHDLRDIFRKYGDLKKDPERAPFIQMLFHNVKEDDHFVVVPRSFETPRDAGSNRVHFNYRITLAAIQHLPAPPPPGGLFDHLGPLGTALKALSVAVHDARSYLVEAIDEIEIYRERVRDPEAFLLQTARSINDAYYLVNGTYTTIRVGLEFFAATSDLLEEVQEAMENDIDGPPTAAQFAGARRLNNIRSSGVTAIQALPQFFQPTLGAAATKHFSGAKLNTPADLHNNAAGATVGTRTRLALGSARAAGLNIGQFSGSRIARVQAGDTIDGISAKQGIPREALIALNNLRYPFITAGGGPGTLQPGDDILIPVRASGRNDNPQPSGAYLTPEDVIYGVDLALDPALAQLGVFDIMVDEVHGAEDAALVRGSANVVQGVQITIGTERGTTDFLPDLGIKRTPGMKGTVNNMLLASLYLREAILSDPRVKSILSTRIVLDGDVLSQEVTPELIGSREGVTIVVPFGKASR